MPGDDLDAATIDAAITRVMEQRCERGTPWDVAVLACAEGLKRLRDGKRSEHETVPKLVRPDVERLYEQAMEQTCVWAEKHAKEFVRAEKAEARVEQLESFLNRLREALK